MRDTPDLELLSAFVAVAEHRSFSRAASVLGLPKSSVSRRVSRLEHTLRTPLFHRSTRAVGLTSAGAELLARVGPLLGAMRAALATLPELRTVPEGELRITTSSSLAGALLSETLARFTQRYSTVKVSITISAGYEDLVAGGIDLALRATGKPLRDSTLRVRKLANLALALYASPNYIARCGEPTTKEALAEHEWISIPRFEPAVKALRPSSRARIESNELLFVRDMLVAGAGIAPLPSYLCREQLASGALVRILPRWSDDRGRVWLLQPRTDHEPLRVRAFKALLFETLGSSPL